MGNSSIMTVLLGLILAALFAPASALQMGCTGNTLDRGSIGVAEFALAVRSGGSCPALSWIGYVDNVVEVYECNYNWSAQPCSVAEMEQARADLDKYCGRDASGWWHNEDWNKTYGFGFKGEAGNVCSNLKLATTQSDDDISTNDSSHADSSSNDTSNRNATPAAAATRKYRHRRQGRLMTTASTHVSGGKGRHI